MVIYLYWAVKKGHPLWDEELVAESDEKLNIEVLKKLLDEKGYHSLRESVYKLGEKPDFKKAVKL